MWNRRNALRQMDALSINLDFHMNFKTIQRASDWPINSQILRFYIKKRISFWWKVELIGVLPIIFGNFMHTHTHSNALCTIYAKNHIVIIANINSMLVKVKRYDKCQTLLNMYMAYLIYTLIWFKIMKIYIAAHIYARVRYACIYPYIRMKR